MRRRTSRRRSKDGYAELRGRGHGARARGGLRLEGQNVPVDGDGAEAPFRCPPVVGVTGVIGDGCGVVYGQGNRPRRKAGMVVAGELGPLAGRDRAPCDLAIALVACSGRLGSRNDVHPWNPL